jgi:hypothetical protein
VHFVQYCSGFFFETVELSPLLNKFDTDYFFLNVFPFPLKGMHFVQYCSGFEFGFFAHTS